MFRLRSSLVLRQRPELRVKAIIGGFFNKRLSMDVCATQCKLRMSIILLFCYLVILLFCFWIHKEKLITSKKLAICLHNLSVITQFHNLPLFKYFSHFRKTYVHVGSRSTTCSFLSQANIPG